MSARVVFALGLLAVAALGAGAGAATDPTTAPATATAMAVRIVVPGTNGAGTTAVAAPPSANPVTTAGYAYPEGGAVLTVFSTNAAATTDDAGEAAGTSGVTGLSIFGGEITADSVLGRAGATSGTSSADGDFDGTVAQNLQALGVPVTATSGTQVPLADWGTLTVGTRTVERSGANGTADYLGSVAALEITLTADHGGLPAGSRIQIGTAQVAAHAVPPAPEPTTTAATTTRPEPKPTTVAGPTDTEPATTVPEPGQKEPKPPAGPPEKPRVPEPPPGLFPLPPELSPTLEGGPYIFPVFGSTSYGDSYGGFRGDVSYHHGVDIFGELGQPIVAITDGTVFSVGWNKLGGNRLWLRDRQGNAYYYAHLSAFSTLIGNGIHVKTGQVVGFMGNTGDADTTPTHLHFEVHPVSLLYLGYDGAVDPTPYVDEWKHLGRLPYPVPPGWAPSQTGGNAAPQPGVVLLDVSDISSADGLDPASLQRAIEATQARP